MIEANLLRSEGILIINPTGEIQATDIDRLSLLVNPYLEENGKLNGILIFFEPFPGWENFSTMLKHLKFVDNYHRRVARVAMVTDSKVKAILPKLADIFVSADVRHFEFQDRDAAEDWLKSV
jgi:hypothetical protein